MGTRHSAAIARLAVTGLFLLPLVFMGMAAFRPSGLPLASPLWPAQPTLENFRRLFAVLPIGRYTLNSLLVVLAAVPLTIVTASWAGFAMARLPRPAQRRWVVLSFLALMVPGIALWPARFLIYSRLGVAGSLWALVVPAFMGTGPFFVLMFYRAFRRVPPAVYDSARLDGAGALASWGRVALPIARPTAMAVGILAFILYWSDFISPLIYLRDSGDYTLPVALQLLEQLGRSDYPLLMAGALWATLAPLVLVVVGVFVLGVLEYRRGKRSISADAP